MQNGLITLDNYLTETGYGAQTKLARESGISMSQISRFVARQQRISTGVALRIKRASGNRISLWSLLQR